MAKRHKNKKGFMVIRTENLAEILKFGGFGICDHCNQHKKTGTGYLVAVLNRWFCDECYTEWYNRAKRYEEDIPYEQRTFNYYQEVLELKEE